MNDLLLKRCRIKNLKKEDLEVNQRAEVILSFYAGIIEFGLKEVNEISYFVSLSLVYLNTLFAIVKTKTRIASWLLLAFMWILFWGNYENADYTGYVYVYGLVEEIPVFDSPYGFLFTLLMKSSASLGLTYNQFLGILSVIGLSLIIYVTEKLSPRPAFVYVLYFMYPFLFDVVQIRHFLAMAIVFFSSSYLFSEKKHGSLKYLFGVGIASLFHIAAILMVLIVGSKVVKRRTLVLVVMAMSLCGSLIVLSGQFSNVVSYILPYEKMVYFTSRTRYGWILYAFIQFIFMLLLFYSRFLISQKNSRSELKYCEHVLNANIVLIVLIPLYLLNSNLFRLYRFILLPNYVVYSIALLKANKRMVLMLIFLFVVVVIGFWSIYLNHGDTVFFPIMEKNLFFEFFR